MFSDTAAANPFAHAGV